MLQSNCYQKRTCNNTPAKCIIYIKKTKCDNNSNMSPIENNQNTRKATETKSVIEINEEMPPEPRELVQEPKPILSLYNTGVDINHNSMAVGSIDTHYTLIEGPGILKPTSLLVVEGHPLWQRNDTSSSWLSMNPVLNNILPGTYKFETNFDLTNFVIGSVSIKLSAMVDDLVSDVLINNISTGLKFSTYTTFSTEQTISNGFVQGINQLTFIVKNYLSHNNPAGLRVRINGFGIPKS